MQQTNNQKQTREQGLTSASLGSPLPPTGDGKHVPPLMPQSQKRTHCVSTRLNVAELSRLDAERGKTQRGEWMRHVFLGSTPPSVPALNRAAWVELSRSASNLNQLARVANLDGLDIDQVRAELAQFRAALIGARF